MKYTLLLFSILISFNSFGQESRDLELVNKKKPQKNKVVELPCHAKISFKGEEIKEIVIITNITDSTINVLRHAGAEEKSHNEYVEFYSRLVKEQEKIKENKKLKRKVRKTKIDSLTLLAMQDSIIYVNPVVYKIDDIGKVLLYKKEQSNLALGSVLTLYTISSIAFMGGVLGGITDSSQVLTESDKQLNRALGLGGLAGMAVSLYLLKVVASDTYSQKRWSIKSTTRITPVGTKED